MRIKIQTLLWAVLITLSTVTAIHSQETQPINSAAVSASIQVATNGAKQTSVKNDCETELSEANQRLLKTLDALEKAERAISALQAELKARESLDKINDDLLIKKDEIIKNQADLIKILEKQSGRKLSIFFGLIKVRY